MVSGWNVKKTVCCARCGADIEFGLWEQPGEGRQVLGVEGIRFDVFNLEGEGILTEDEHVPMPLCNECYASLEKWLETGAEDD